MPSGGKAGGLRARERTARCLGGARTAAEARCGQRQHVVHDLSSSGSSRHHGGAVVAAVVVCAPTQRSEGTSRLPKGDRTVRGITRRRQVMRVTKQCGRGWIPDDERMRAGS
jgi:hypothetical protein